MGMTSVTALVLAAGRSSRMKTAYPKPLHRLHGKPMIAHVLTTLASIDTIESAKIIVSPDHRSAYDKAVDELCLKLDVHLLHQPNANGTGGAVNIALDGLQSPITLICLGDVPMVEAEDLRAMITIASDQQRLVMATALFKDPTGYGRVISDENNQVLRIVEQKHCTPKETLIQQVNTGLLCLPTHQLKQLMMWVKPNPETGEYYLTDIIDYAHRLQGKTPLAYTVPQDRAWRFQGVNKVEDMMALEKRLMQTKINHCLSQGVRLQDPSRFTLLGNLVCGQDVEIHADVRIEGDVVLGDGVVVEQGAILLSSTIGSRSRIRAYSVLEGVCTQESVVIGPFAYGRQGTVMAEFVEVGCFVETKNTKLGPRTKAKHLSYLGDLTTGADVNVGAGVIHCNYDGQRKHTTTLGSRVFVGADSQLIGPITVGDDTLVGAGSTVVESVPDQHWCLSRQSQKTWVPKAHKQSTKENLEKAEQDQSVDANKVNELV